jgi:hypothetical protein
MAKLPFPDEQPIAVNALRNMRAKISGKIAMHTREIDRPRAELIHIDATLRLFDPSPSISFLRWRVDGLKLGVMHRSRVISGMGSSGETGQRDRDLGGRD